MVSSPSVTVRIGNATTISTLAQSEAHTNTGMRVMVMPGARIFRIVAMKLTPVSVVPIPETCNAQM